MRSWRPRLAAVLSGALLTLAFPEVDYWWLGFVGLVPLLLVIRSAPTGREGAIRAWAGATGFFVTIHYWLLPNTGIFTIAIAPALGLLWLPFGRGAWTLLHGRIDGRRLAAAVVVLPALWVVIEFLRSWDRLAGPWGLLGSTQWRNLRVLAVASIGGVWLVSFVLVAVSVAVTVTVLPDVAARTRGAAAALAVGLVALAYAAPVLQPEGTTGEVVRVAGVQPGHVSGYAERFDAHLAATRSLAGEGLDLVAWGESSVGFDLEDRPEQMARLQEISAAVGADILVNVDARRGRGGIYKSSVLVGPDGPRGRYDKMRLVPFGEYVPLRFLFGWAPSVTEAAIEDRKRGSGIAVLRADTGDGDVALGPLVCFESAFPDMSRELARAGAELIVVETATTTFQGTWAQGQHAALSAVRAAESGRPVVHAAVSGVSAVYDAHGRRLAHLDNHSTGTYAAAVPLAGGRTLYVRWGDWLPAVSFVIVLLALVGAGLRAARRPAPDRAEPSVESVPALREDAPRALARP